MLQCFQMLPKMDTGQAIPIPQKEPLKRQARKEEKQQRQCGERLRLGDTFQSERPHKRRRVGPFRPTYIQRADLLGKDQDQIVGKILMRMTPHQCKSRCTHNMVHFVLCEQQRQNPFWTLESTCHTCPPR
jgi:hypothetical protein